MPIRRLSETMINQIAAGEVVERPASVVKELVENAIDAGATRIDIATAGGGKNLIRITDNGCGIMPDQLLLAVSRHCTSKMGDDIHDIRALGFRGEALPSIASVSRLRLLSRHIDLDEGAEIIVTAGKIEGPRPAAVTKGTVVEVKDLFFATPARLKFLKTERAESTAISDVVKRIAIAFPHIRFTLSGPDRSLSEYAGSTKDLDGLSVRLGQILGKEFSQNMVELNAEREGVKLSGFVGVPSFNRGNALHQFVYVNGRPIKDKTLSGAIRGAYSDAIAPDRHGVVALFITIDPQDVDVNVHPAKADVRFRDPGLVRGLIVGGIRSALQQSGIQPATTGASAMLSAFRTEQSTNAAMTNQMSGQPAHSSYQNKYYQGQNKGATYRPQSKAWTPQNGQAFHRPLDDNHVSMPAKTDILLQEQLGAFMEPSADLRPNLVEPAIDQLNAPLGAPRAQIHKNYIVSQTQDSLIIVDQHAAHERLVYEALKEALYDKPLPSQMLLIPEIVDLPQDDVDRLMNHANTLQKFGLGIEAFGEGALAVQETPAMLGEIDAQALIRDLADEVAEHDTADGLKSMLDYVAATMACHGSVRSGRILKAEEMNALLRQMEATPGSGTCNHGRPTYIELKLHDIERLFGRR
ncbi:DNA mismatch repair endonuclease MutL [Bartonella sp. HY038]|uniref:DNA mismatch repair endonuclease MutL n=1 Tax=Bartonella sp. HY038 TaxID=2759660 RepID=UPI0015FDC2B5|nr:DNA mismatch repair endonuclease MutL [Bartonella sp. HY038]